MTIMEEESRERLYGVRYEGTENYAYDWGSFFITAEEARYQAKILTDRYGKGFYSVFVDTVTSVGRI